MVLLLCLRESISECQQVVESILIVQMRAEREKADAVSWRGGHVSRKNRACCRHNPRGKAVAMQATHWLRQRWRYTQSCTAPLSPGSLDQTCCRMVLRHIIRLRVFWSYRLGLLWSDLWTAVFGELWLREVRLRDAAGRIFGS